MFIPSSKVGTVSELVSTCLMLVVDVIADT
jgi:hypothetical protein